MYVHLKLNKMIIELVNDLIPGQLMYRCKKENIRSHRILKEHLIYVGNCYSSDHHIQKFQLHKQTHNFYRFVSKEEYVRKVQEKYESIILNIVFKHLINEDFVW